ncbi:RTA1 like protein-domain-containing protein [Annulohypoxylon nitens]|nr:RTA1 like protein-domain-containing protein [Annulohypoxylon nitens]
MLTSRAELLPYKGNFYLWKYVPSMAAAIIFILLFGLCSVAHTWKMFNHRMWFCLPFVIGGYLEVVGFVGRAAATNATDQLIPYCIQSVFLLVPPSLFAASIYMTLGRIIRGLGSAAESCSIIRVRWLTTIFVVGDFFSFMIQSGGAGFMAAGSNAKMGENIVVAGLVIQILFFCLFVAAALLFHLRYRQHSVVSKAFGRSSFNLRQAITQRGDAKASWESMMSMLYATSALILARCVFRIIEYGMGSEGYLLAHEWTLYIFDGILMVAMMVIFYIWYPSQVYSIGEAEAERQYTMGSQELHGGGRSDI